MLLALLQVRIEAADVGGLRVVALGGEVMGTDIVLRWAPLVMFRGPRKNYLLFCLLSCLQLRHKVSLSAYPADIFDR